MKNVTLSIDDRILELARKLAAERGTSVNRMIREFLARETNFETDEQYRSRMRLVELAGRPDIPRRLTPWTREELYDRGVSGYERDRLRGLGADSGPAEVGEGGGDHER